MAFRGTLQEYGKGPSTGEMFAEAFGNLGRAGAEGVVDIFQKREQAAKDAKVNEMLSQLTGLDAEALGGLSPEERRDLLKQGFQQKGQREIEELKGQQPSKDEMKAEEKAHNIQGALDTVKKMREIRGKGNIGGWVKAGTHLLGGETARDKGEYEQLGKSLISYSSNIPIRNRLEFETLAERLYDASITDAEAEGVLNAMEKILSDSLGASSEMTEEFEEEVIPLKKGSSKKSSLKEIFG